MRLRRSIRQAYTARRALFVAAKAGSVPGLAREARSSRQRMAAQKHVGRLAASARTLQGLQAKHATIAAGHVNPCCPRLQDGAG